MYTIVLYSYLVSVIGTIVQFSVVWEYDTFQLCSQ